MIKLVKRNFLYLVFCFLIFGCVKTSDLKSVQDQQEILEKRIVELENHQFNSIKNLIEDSKKLKQLVFRKIKQFQNNHLFYLRELDQLKEDIRSLTLIGELNQNQIRKTQKRFAKLKLKLGNQAILLESIQKLLKEEVPSFQGEKESEKAYKKAFQNYKRRNYERSLKEFEEFRQKFPNSNQQDKSLFHIAHIHYLQARYENASLHYYEFLQLFSDSDKIDEAKWWLGVSLERTGDLKSAIDIYKQLTKLDENNPNRIKAEYRLDELEPLN